MIVPAIYKEVIFYVLIPIFVVLIMFAFILLCTSRKRDEIGQANYNYKVDYWSGALGVILGSSLTSLAIGFSTCFIIKIYKYDLANRYMIILVMLYILPVITIGFLIYFINMYVKVLKKKAKGGLYE